MRGLSKVLSVVAVLALGSEALADQCWLMSGEQGQKAAARLATLKPGDVILMYCEPCGMKTPERIVIHTVQDGAVNGKGLDAAYVFVPEGSPTTGARKFVNLAKIAGCPTSGVSPNVTVDPSTLKESAAAPKPKPKDAAPAFDAVDLWE